MSLRKEAFDEFEKQKNEWQKQAVRYTNAYNDREDAKTNAAYRDADERCKRADEAMTLISRRMNAAYDKMHQGAKSHEEKGIDCAYGPSPDLL